MAKMTVICECFYPIYIYFLYTCKGAKVSFANAMVTLQIWVPSDQSVALFFLKSWGDHSVTAVTTR